MGCSCRVLHLARWSATKFNVKPIIDVAVPTELDGGVYLERRFQRWMGLMLFLPLRFIKHNFSTMVECCSDCLDLKIWRILWYGISNETGWFSSYSALAFRHMICSCYFHRLFDTTLQGGLFGLLLPIEADLLTSKYAVASNEMETG